MFEYKNLISRNWAYVPQEVQEKLKKTRVMLAGCGLGSNIARDLAALGVCNFSLYDGDIVEISNLNRQAFNITLEGKNKAEAASEIIRNINPNAKTDVHPFFIQDLNKIEEDLADVDFVVNTVDFDSPVFLSLTDFAKKKGKNVLFPINVGYGGVVMLFSPSSICMSEYLNVPPDTSCDLDVFIERLSRDYLPDYLKDLCRLVLANKENDEWTNTPQIVVGAQIVSAITCTMILKILSGTPVKPAPAFYPVDTWEIG